MKIVLLHDISDVGKKGEVKTVADGYALNRLIPRGLAETATPAALERVGRESAALSAAKSIAADLLAKNLRSLAGVRITITERASEKGHLFASVHPDRIVAALKTEAHIDLDPAFIVLEHPIKAAGEYTVRVKTGESEGSFTLVVAAAKE